MSARNNLFANILSPNADRATAAGQPVDTPIGAPDRRPLVTLTRRRPCERASARSRLIMKQPGAVANGRLSYKIIVAPVSCSQQTGLTGPILIPGAPDAIGELVSAESQPDTYHRTGRAELKVDDAVQGCPIELVNESPGSCRSGLEMRCHQIVSSGKTRSHLRIVKTGQRRTNEMPAS